MPLDFSSIFDLIWKVITTILKKEGVFETLAGYNIDLSKYILTPSTDETKTK